MICPKCVQPKFVYPCTIPPLVSVYRPATLLLGEGGHVPLGAFTFLFLWVVVFFLHALWTFTRIPQPTRFLFAGEGVLSLSPGGGAHPFASWCAALFPVCTRKNTFAATERFAYIVGVDGVRAKARPISDDR